MTIVGGVDSTSCGSQVDRPRVVRLSSARSGPTDCSSRSTVKNRGDNRHKDAGENDDNEQLHQRETVVRPWHALRLYFSLFTTSRGADEPFRICDGEGDFLGVQRAGVVLVQRITGLEAERTPAERGVDGRPAQELDVGNSRSLGPTQRCRCLLCGRDRRRPSRSQSPGNTARGSPRRSDRNRLHVFVTGSEVLIHS